MSDGPDRVEKKETDSMNSHLIILMTAAQLKNSYSFDVE